MLALPLLALLPLMAAAPASFSQGGHMLGRTHLTLDGTGPPTFKHFGQRTRVLSSRHIAKAENGGGRRRRKVKRKTIRKRQAPGCTSSSANSTLHTSTTAGPSSSFSTVESTSAVPTPTTSSAPPAQTTPTTVDRAGIGPFRGEGTWYDVGLSACGTYDKETMPVVAMSEYLFDSWPGFNGENPNNNPICGHHLNVTYGGKTITVEVTDRCPGCSERSLDLSKTAFQYLAPLTVGRFDSSNSELEWKWVDGYGRLPERAVGSD